jgi:hypothetical protein
MKMAKMRPSTLNVKNVKEKVMSTTTLIKESDLKKISEITRLHDEAFWHLHQFDGHAKSSDGHLELRFNFGTVWDRENGATSPRIEVDLYSYVVATEGDRRHEFTSLDEALAIVKNWHKKALEYNPTAEEIAEMDKFAADMWNAIKDKVTVIEVNPNEE